MTRETCPGLVRRQGRTLLEMTLVVCASMAIISGGLTIFRQAQASMQAYQMTSAVAGMVAELQKIAADGDYFSIGNRTVMQRGIFPPELIVEGRIMSQMGTEIEVLTPPPFDRFIVMLHDLPEMACRRILGGGNAILGPELGALSLTVNDIDIPPKRPFAGACLPGDVNRLAIAYR